MNNTFGNVADERRFCERLHEMAQPGDLRWVEVAAARDAASDELQTVAQQRSGSLAQAGAWRDLDERARLFTAPLYVTCIGRPPRAHRRGHRAPRRPGRLPRRLRLPPWWPVGDGAPAWRVKGRSGQGVFHVVVQRQ